MVSPLVWTYVFFHVHQNHGYVSSLGSGHGFWSDLKLLVQNQWPNEKRRTGFRFHVHDVWIWRISNAKSPRNLLPEPETISPSPCAAKICLVLAWLRRLSPRQFNYYVWKKFESKNNRKHEQSMPWVIRVSSIIDNAAKHCIRKNGYFLSQYHDKVRNYKLLHWNMDWNSVTLVKLVKNAVSRHSRSCLGTDRLILKHNSWNLKHGFWVRSQRSMVYEPQITIGGLFFSKPAWFSKISNSSLLTFNSQWNKVFLV